MRKISIIILLIAAIAFLIYQRTANTIKEELRDFAIEEVASIQKIYFADRHGGEVSLSRGADGWLINEQYPAREDAIELLLSTMQKLKVKNPVAESMHNSVVKSLATNSVKVEIYTDDLSNASKVYYVGSEAINHLGSYMILENSSKAFVMHLPGSNGFLAPKYNIDGSRVNSDLWREREVYQYEPEHIQSISVTHHEDEAKSFTVKRADSTFTFSNANGTSKLPPALAAAYFESFNSVYCEGFMNTFSKKDSILNSQPFHTIHIVAKGQKTTLHTYHKKPRSVKLNSEGIPRKWDIDRLFAQKDDDLLLIQFKTFNPLVAGPAAFSVEK